MNEWIYFINEEIEAREGKSSGLTHRPGRAREIHTQASKFLLIRCTSRWIKYRRFSNIFQESRAHCFITRLDKLVTTYILALDMADCIISLFPTHMEQLSSCASVGNSSYVARVAFWDYIFRGVQEEELAVLINESERQEESWQGPCRRDGWGLNRAMAALLPWLFSRSPTVDPVGKQCLLLQDILLSHKPPSQGCWGCRREGWHWRQGAGQGREGEGTEEIWEEARRGDKDVWKSWRARKASLTQVS